MRVLRAVSIGFLSVIAGCILAFFVGDYLTQLAHMSNMEGGRGMFVLFFCGPLGILAGLIVGIVVSILVRRSGAAGFFFALGLSILTLSILGGLTAGIPYLFSDKPPRIDGKRLVIEFELRIPPQVSIPDSGHGDDVRAILYSGDRDFAWASIDLTTMRRTPEGAIIPGQAELLTHNPARWLLVALGYDLTAGQRIDLKLPGSPGPANERWSDWSLATRRADFTPVPEPERFALRYRVQPIER
jgi:hypothetical protein